MGTPGKTFWEPMWGGGEGDYLMTYADNLAAPINLGEGGGVHLKYEERKIQPAKMRSLGKEKNIC